MAGYKMRKEEYTTLADFMLPSFTRDLATFQERFPKFNSAFLESFNSKNNFIKNLESSIVITQKQKNATASLYEEATLLNNELSFLKENFKDAGLNTNIIVEVKNDLNTHNIEGAILKIESLKQFIVANQVVLESEGMSSTFPTQLANHKSSFEVKNTDQSEYMKQIKRLTDDNKAHYEELYQFITKVANKGKLLFKESRAKEEYVITKNIGKMRAARQAQSATPKA
jgi:hypothetical protein